MPSRNRVKTYVPQSYYHIYNRGVNKRKIFLDDQDYRVFLNLLKRYLDEEPAKDNKGREYESLHGRIKLLAYCLMPNHFHLLIYQENAEDMTRLLRGVATSYTKYFNKKHKRIGPLFQDAFKASHIVSDEYLQHISRYIHLNPQGYKSWPYSSLDYYLNRKSAGWVEPDMILGLFGPGEYERFVADYEDHKRALEEIKTELANSDEIRFQRQSLETGLVG